MKIGDIELFLVDMGQYDAPGMVRSLLVRVTTDAGTEGWGESGLGWRSSELGTRRDALLAVLAGRSVYDLEELRGLESLSPSPLRSAVEMAVWDLLGRTLRQPLCNLLGGYYRRRVPAAMQLAGHKPGMMALIARELADQGFHTQTIAGSGNLDEDLAALHAVHDVLGGRIELRFDAMGRYDLETARDLAAGVEYLGLQFLLDPLAVRDLHALASLGRQTTAPLGAWRSIHGPSNVLTAVRCGAAPFVIVDLDQVGGIGAARACAAIAAAGGVMPVLGGRPSVGIATAAMLHLAASTAAFSTASEIASRLLRDNVLADTLDIADGMVAVPQSPGLGVVVDRAKVERYQAA
jgi:L-alanine-DL-glutamate epimerase-like enolase superfamily enzyme